MKKAITLFAAILIMIIGSTMNAHAQSNFTNEQKVAVINTIKQQLPMKIDDNITWTEASLSADGTVFNIVMLVNAQGMGITNAEMREAFAEIGAERCKQMIGEEFLSTLQMLQLDCKLTFKFNDSTPPLTFMIRR